MNYPHQRRLLATFLWAGLLTLSASVLAHAAARVSLDRSLPAVVSRSTLLRRLEPATPVTAVLTLPLRDPAGLDDFLAHVSDPADPLYGHYLTPAEFTARFGPTQADYDTVAAYAHAQGLTVAGVHTNRLLLDVSGPASAVESALQVHLNQYKAPDGHEFHAPDQAPSVPLALAGRISGVVGLSDAAVRRPYKLKLRASDARPQTMGGTGPLGGLAPSDIKKAYNLSGLTLTGAGQTLAVFELDGYTASDVQVYLSRFSLGNVPLQNVLIAGATGSAGSGKDEVTLDIELEAALAPGATKILVYETANSDTGTIDGYSRIAEDNLAKQISTSWGLDEPDSTSRLLQSENTIFKQMAAQGQTIYAASGDSGAYDTGQMSDGLTVDDPGSQPYVCSVGGTSLSTNGYGGSYLSETTWNTGSISDGASGGGISRTWLIPSWQQGIVQTSTGSSTTMRNVPDVALDADPNSGYAIYIGGRWTVYGGCSCAAPLWASFTALVNQQRVASGLSTLGQASPALYPLLNSARYALDFHDIADGSTNLYYRAVTGYDNATGLGTLNGANLIADLAPSTVSAWTGTSVAVGGDGLTRLLWDNTDTRNSVWTLNGTNVTSTPILQPGTGWSAKDVSLDTAGNTHVLWINADGRMTVWTITKTNAISSLPIFQPGNGWAAQALSMDTAGNAHVLWFNSDGRMAVWTITPQGTATSTAIYQPGNGWGAVSLVVDGQSSARVLWYNTDGRMAVWTITSGGRVTSSSIFQPGGGWQARKVSVDGGGSSHVLWFNPDGRMSVWSIDGSNGVKSTSVYQPGSGWSAVGLCVDGAGSNRVLWDNTDGRTAVWTITAGGSVTSTPIYQP